MPTTKHTPYVRMRAHTIPTPYTQSTTTMKRQPMRMKTLDPNTKRLNGIPRPQQAKLLDDIVRYVVCNAEEVTRLGWTEFVRRQRGRGDFASLSEVKHPERCLL